MAFIFHFKSARALVALAISSFITLQATTSVPILSLILMYRTKGAEGSQPAMKIRRNEDVNKMCKINDVNVRMNVMYNMCACYYCVL
jgi:hypothetical protein